VACPACDAPVVAFEVPESLQEYAPADATAICTVCLRTTSADAAGVVPDQDPDFAAVSDAFPSGRAAVAFALALGKLGSLALERAAIEALCEETERAGADVRLALDRLAHEETLEPHFDLPRRTEQLDSFR
jgi:hypothetical protein